MERSLRSLSPQVWRCKDGSPEAKIFVDELTMGILNYIGLQWNIMEYNGM